MDNSLVEHAIEHYKSCTTVYKNGDIIVLPIPNDPHGFLIVENDVFRHVIYDVTKKIRMERLELIRQQLQTDPPVLPLISEEASYASESESESDSESDTDSESEQDLPESKEFKQVSFLENENS
jgi:hypothetical protein